MVTLQSVQGHAGLTRPFNFLTFRCSGAQDWAPEHRNVNNLKGGLEQYGAECSGRLIFATITKKCGPERVNQTAVCLCIQTRNVLAADSSRDHHSLVLAAIPLSEKVPLYAALHRSHPGNGFNVCFSRILHSWLCIHAVRFWNGW